MNVSHGRIMLRISDAYGVVLVNTLPWHSCSVLVATEE